MKQQKVQIVGYYSTACFCQKPALKPVITNYYPRFYFKKAVREFCRINNLRLLWVNSKAKVAGAVLDRPCDHRRKQEIRITWKLCYES